MKKLSFQNWDCKIVEKKKIWFSISIAIILVGVIIMSLFGFNVGIDFSGGTVLTITSGDLYEESDYQAYKTSVQEVLAQNGVKAEVEQKLSSNSASGIQVRFKNEINGVKADESAMESVNTNVRAQAEEKIIDIILASKPNTSQNSLNQNLSVTLSTVGATASANLLFMAFLSIVVASILILLYVAVRFEILSGVSAVIALIHDILAMCALVLIFRIQINASFVAALITIVGYSINNTIVLFDRVRENKAMQSMMNATPAHIINTSIKETMSRSINTTVTTLATILLLAILGVAQVREFALPIIFGLIAGTYSSIFIAPTLWATFKDIDKNHKIKAKEQNRIKA